MNRNIFGKHSITSSKQNVAHAMANFNFEKQRPVTKIDKFKIEK